MAAKDLLPWITGGGGAIVVLAIVCWLFYGGKLHSDTEFAKLEQENTSLKAALDDERKAVDGTVGTAAVTHQLISALVKVATQKRGDHDRRVDGDLTPSDLTPEDLGL